MTAANVRARLAASLPATHLARLEQVRQQAAEAGTPAYLAGGLVRDLLLGRPVTDMDFVVVPHRADEPAPAPKLARALARTHGGQVTVHKAFGTATWQDPDGALLDFATARTETYAHPGALPTVAPATDIATDLRRRDFSINAMAVRVDGDHLGELVDPYGGQTDLGAGVLRVLHPGSFQDDPTRMFRAVRYEQRLNFQMAGDTAGLIEGALLEMAAISGERLRHELELAFRETNPPAVLARMARLGLLAAIHAAMRWDEAETASVAVLPHLPRPTWQWSSAWPLDSIYLALVLRRASADEAAGALERLSANRAVHEAVTGAVELKLSGTRPSEMVAELDSLSLDGVVAAYIAKPEVRENLDTYLSRWRFVRAKITGDDLFALGLPPGPRYKRILGRLRAARLDGEVHDEAGELALVRELAGLE